MYGGIGAPRIYNPNPDPLEAEGPPKRIVREETNLGEVVPSSKKRISWRFTLGESDQTHEVVLVHSLMSYKKVIEYDGRQIHYSATGTLGEWTFTCILDGSNRAIEVRINDVESDTIPKYDLFIDRVPFRRWDIFRRRKMPVTTATYAQPNAPSSTNYGMQKWGPSGMDKSRQPSGQQNMNPPSMPRRSSSGGSITNAPSAYHSGAYNQGYAPPTSYNAPSTSYNAPPTSYNAPPAQTAPPANTGSRQQPRRASQPPKPQPQPEVDLLGDDIPTVSVPAQKLQFDHFANASTNPTLQAPANNAHSWMQSGVQAAGQNMQAPRQNMQASRPMASPSPAVDPFATVNQPPPAPSKPNVNLDPFATTSTSAPRPSPAQSSAPQAQSSAPIAVAPMAPRMTGGVNYNISNYMNPDDVNNPQRRPPGKNINIDPFASMSK